MREVLVRVLAEDYQAQLTALRCPVELVWGDDDTEAPLAMASSALPLLAEGRLTVCQGAGHLLPLSAPAALRGVLERYRQE
ncbi:MAG: alpha/beta fold hydrolase [Acidimicrobiales bacterium]